MNKKNLKIVKIDTKGLQNPERSKMISLNFALIMGTFIVTFDLKLKNFQYEHEYTYGYR